jgi:hypothetical protein
MHLLYRYHVQSRTYLEVLMTRSICYMGFHGAIVPYCFCTYNNRYAGQKK